MPLVSKSAVKRFLNRKLDDLWVVKSLTRKEIVAEIKALDPKPRLKKKPKHWTHQLACFYLGACFDGVLFLLDMGLGKTRIVIDVFRYRRYEKKVERAIIVCLNDLNVYNWVDEVGEYAPSLSVTPVVGTAKQKEAALAQDSDVFVISFPAAGALFKKASKKKTKKKTNKGKSEQVDKKKIRRLLDGIDFLCVDEIHKCKNDKTLTFAVCDEISKLCLFRYGTTGTAFGRDAQDLWAQFYLVDRGETLGITLGLYRSVFFTAKQNPWSGGMDYVLNKKRKKALNRTLRHRSIQYDAEECHDMPKKVYRRFKVAGADAMMDYYRAAVDDIVASMKKKLPVQEKENQFIRMRQITSGFVTVPGHEQDEKIQVCFDKNPKLDAMQSFIEEELPEGSKIVIVHEFRKTSELICERLEKMGVGYVQMIGGIGRKNLRDREQQFYKNEDIRVCVGNWGVIGTGLNKLRVAQYMGFIESPVSPIERRQVESRIRRGNSEFKRSCYIDFVVRDSVDAKIAEYLKEGKDLYNEVISGKKKEWFR